MNVWDVVKHICPSFVGTLGEKKLKEKKTARIFNNQIVQKEKQK